MSFGSLPSVLGNGGGVAISVIGGRGLFADGTAAAPSISFSADPDTGFYRAAANQIRLALGGNGVYTFTSTGNISSTATGATLLLSDATGAIGLTAAGTNQNITLTPSGSGSTNVVQAALSAAGTSNGFVVRDSADTRNVVLGVASTYAWLQSLNAQPLSLNPAGNNVLVGTTVNSGALLQIGTNTATSAGGMVFGTDTNFYRAAAGAIAVNYNGLGSGFRFYESGVWKGATGIYDGDLYLDTFTAKSVIIRTNSTTALTLSSTQAATFASSVTASGFINASTVNSLVKATDGTIVTKIQSLSVGDPNVGYVGTESNHTLKIITNNTARLTIDNAGAATFSGSVALGGALKLANAYVAGAVVGTGYVTIQDSTGTTYRVPVLV